MLRAIPATVSGPRSTAPSTCQRAAVSGVPAVMPSAASSRRPFSRKIFSTSSVSSSPAALRLVAMADRGHEREEVLRLARLVEREPGLERGGREDLELLQDEPGELERRHRRRSDDTTVIDGAFLRDVVLGTLVSARSEPARIVARVFAIVEQACPRE